MLNGAQLTLPLHVVTGREPGPTLGIVTNVHGDEFLPTIAIRELARRTRHREAQGAARDHLGRQSAGDRRLRAADARAARPHRPARSISGQRARQHHADDRRRHHRQRAGSRRRADRLSFGRQRRAAAGARRLQHRRRRTTSSRKTLRSRARSACRSCTKTNSPDRPRITSTRAACPPSIPKSAAPISAPTAPLIHRHDDERPARASWRISACSTATPNRHAQLDFDQKARHELRPLNSGYLVSHYEHADDLGKLIKGGTKLGEVVDLYSYEVLEEMRRAGRRLSVLLALLGRGRRRHAGVRAGGSVGDAEARLRR